MRIIRTLVVLVIVAVVAGLALFGSSAGSYAKAAWNNARKEVEQLVPLNLELDRAEAALEEAKSDIAERKRLHAEISVSVEDLERDLESLETEESTSLATLRRLRDAYAATGNGTRPIALYCGKKVESRAVARRLEGAVVRAESLQTKRRMSNQMLQSRREQLERIEEALHEATSLRDKLGLQLETRRVELECVRLVGEQLGDLGPSSSLAEAREALSKVDRRIRVMRKFAEGDVTSGGELAWLDEQSQGVAFLDRATRLLDANRRGDWSETDDRRLATLAATN